jgi:predicted membrane protein
MSEKSKVKIGSNRSFGLVFFIVFLIISLLPLLSENGIRKWSIGLSLIFLILGLLNSKVLSPFNKIWFKFGLLLGYIAAPIVMGIVFFLVVTPTGFLLKLFGKDILNKKYDNKKKTYWINCNKENSSMKQQF